MGLDRRAVVKKYWCGPETDLIIELLQSRYRKERAVAFLVLTAEFAKGDNAIKNKIRYLTETANLL